jgi:hypothetical protein
MGRIKGHYEWDDDDLTPGRKKEGGLHQNLFDSEGNLRGSARFIPDDGDDEPLTVTQTVFVHIDERRDQEDWRYEALSQLAVYLINEGIPKAKPYVEQWWRELARPAIDARRAKALERRERRRARNTVQAEIATAEPPTQEPGHELATEVAQDRPDMSLAEARARFLAALAARAYSDEQMRLVNGSNIVGNVSMAELKSPLAELPPVQVVRVIEAMATNPSLLGEDTLAQLASMLGRHGLDLPSVDFSEETVPGVRSPHAGSAEKHPS